MKPDEKVLIFDSSSLISITMNGLLEEFKELKKLFNGRFIIPQEVKHEVIDKPLTIKRFELEALKIKELLEMKILEMPSAIGINDKDVSEKTLKLSNLVNSTFVGNGRDIHLIDSGETACLVLSDMLNKKGIKNVFVIDERTTRMFIEKPDNLMKLLEEKMHVKVLIKKEQYKNFENFKIIRSTELIYVAYRKGLIKLKDPMILDALLYALKFNGCSISDEEIKEIKGMK